MFSLMKFYQKFIVVYLPLPLTADVFILKTKQTNTTKQNKTKTRIQKAEKSKNNTHCRVQSLRNLHNDLFMVSKL